MLKSVCFSNFVKFKDDNYLDFSNDSPFIFIGENGTGKSSVLEGIRRCLEPKLNTNVSSAPDPKGLSYFICNFENFKISDSDRENVLSGIVVMPDELENESMHSSDNNSTDELDNGSVDREQQESMPISNTNKQPVYKFITKYSDKSENTSLHVAERDQNGQFVHWLTIQTDVNFINAFTGKTESAHSFLMKTFNKQNIAKVKEESFETQDGRSPEEYSDLSKMVVFTFALHSIGPLQWSKSPRYLPGMRNSNYKITQNRCEIIKYFFEKEGNDEFNEEKEKEYFRDITTKTDTYFACINENGVCEVSTQNGDHYGLLKIPEGIYAAKIISILLSSTLFKTIILEEPDRGMHPQFVDRMMQVIEQCKEDKRIILTTHNKALITPWSLPKCFVFRNSNDKYHIVTVRDTDLKTNLKTLRLCTADHVSDIFFARKVLFFEGDSEMLFFSELKKTDREGRPV